MSTFDRFIGIDYSGANDPASRNGALRVFESSPLNPPKEVRGRAGGNWTRQDVAVWLDRELRGPARTIVGIDHAFSFPTSYMQRFALSTWDAFLDDFAQHWPTDLHTVASLRVGNLRAGTPDELRMCDQWTSSAKSVFRFDVQGQVAMSTHAGLPWLRALRRAVSPLHFWPFDGWSPATGVSVITEVYPSIFRRRFARAPGAGNDAHDAGCIAAWLRQRDRSLSTSLRHPMREITEQPDWSRPPARAC